MTAEVAPEAPIWHPSEVPTNPGALAPTPVPPTASPAASATVGAPPDKAERPLRADKAPGVPSLTEAENAVNEVTGWWKHGRRHGGQFEFAHPDVIVLAAPHMENQDLLRVFTKISTSKWIDLRVRLGGVSPSLIETADKKHFEFGGEQGGGLMGSLPVGDPRDAAKTQDSGLPQSRFVKRKELTPNEAVGMVVSDE